MSSLDEVYEQMRVFQRVLTDFNAEIRTSSEALAKAHETVCGLWQDEAGLRYRQAYEPLAHSLDRYLHANAPRFEKFLDAKVHKLEQYLHG